MLRSWLRRGRHLPKLSLSGLRPRDAARPTRPASAASATASRSIRPSSRRTATRSSGSSAPSCRQDGPTPLWNAVNTAIDKLLLEPGRRVVLVFTDGVDKPLNFSNRQQVAQGRDEARRRRQHHGLRDRSGGPERHAGLRRGAAATAARGLGPGGIGGSVVAGSAAMAADSRRWRNPTKGCRRSRRRANRDRSEDLSGRYRSTAA